MTDRDLALRVPYRDVGVRPNRDRALLRIEAVNLGVVGRAEGDKTIEIDAALDHALREQNWQPRCYPRNAVRHPAKTRTSLWRQLSFRIVVAERTMVGGEDRKHLLLKPVPARFLTGFVARRRRTDVFGAFHVELIEILFRQHKILRAS